MNFIKNNWFGIAVLAVVFFAFSFSGGPSLGGVTNFDQLDTTDGYAVDGTTVIDGSGNWDGALTPSSFLEPTEAVTANNTLTASETGKTFFISGAESTTTLPAVATATGTVYRFVVGGSLTGDFHVDSAEGDNIEGSAIVAGAVVDCDAEDQLNFISDGENLGDFVELRSNGQKWFLTLSNVLTAAKLTCTDPT